MRKYKARRGPMFRFWLDYSRKKILKRRRRLLAEVMGTENQFSLKILIIISLIASAPFSYYFTGKKSVGCYTLKARTFARIKLFNYTNRRVVALVLKFDKPVKRFRQVMK